MASATTVVIDLGTKSELAELYSYPNRPGSKERLSTTILHWFKKTLSNDGFEVATAKTATARSVVPKLISKGDRYELQLTGPASLKGYQERLPVFLDHGRAALLQIGEIKKADTAREKEAKAKGKKVPKRHWDPRNLKNWRFFMPHGLAMINQKSVQFFHYPPIRLLETDRDYLKDPVPKRWEGLLMANGVPAANVELYETVMDAVPVGALDDEGSARDGGMPINDFVEYQEAQVDLLLGAPNRAGSTIPIVVFGSNPRARFFKTYKAGFPAVVQKAKKWNVQDPHRVEIKPGSTTPVLAVNHPYSFFMDIQTKKGEEFIPGVTKYWKSGIRKMLESLVAARWQKLMAAKPSQDPIEVFATCEEYWGAWPRSVVTKKGKKTTAYIDEGFRPATKQAQRDAAAAMILHQASLEAGLTGEWKFVRSLADAKELVRQFKSKGKVQQESLLPAEKATMINDMLAFLCSANS
jgi:hypothetical protein